MKPLEEPAHLVGDADPHLLEHAVALAVVVLADTVVSGPSTAARISASVISLGRAGEHVAAADAALGAHEPGALHREQDLLEVRLGEVGALRDLLDRRRPVGLVQRERQQRPGRVVAARRDLHPRSWSRSDAGRGERAVDPVAVGGLRTWSVASRRCPSPCRRRLRRAAASPRSSRRSLGGRRRRLAARRRCATPRSRGRCSCSTASAGTRSTRTAALLPTLARARGRADHDGRAVDDGDALTSITTGLAPSQHGVVGLPDPRRRRGAQRALVAGRTGAAPPDPCIVQRHAPFLRPAGPGRHQERVPRAAGSPRRTCAARAFHGWHAVVGARRALPAARRRGGAASSTRTTRASTRSRTRTGCTTASTPPSSRSPTGSSATCSTRSPATPRSLVTADHGQVHLDAEAGSTLGALDELVDVCSGDGRFRYLHARRARPTSCSTRRARRARRPRVGLGPRRAARRRLARARPPAARSGAGSATSCSPRATPVAFVDPALPREAQLRSGPRLAHRRRDAGPARSAGHRDGAAGRRASRGTRRRRRYGRELTRV